LNLTTEIDLPKAFGLDFGTTNSALAHAAPDGTVRLAQFSGDATFRSVIYFDEDEAPASRKYRVGRRTGRDPEVTSMPKHRVDSSNRPSLYLASRLFTQTQIFGETYSLEELIGILLRYLRKSAEAQFGDLGTTLVAGRPVHFSGTQDDGRRRVRCRSTAQRFCQCRFHRRATFTRACGRSL